MCASTWLPASLPENPGNGFCSRERKTEAAKRFSRVLRMQNPRLPFFGKLFRQTEGAA